MAEWGQAEGDTEPRTSFEYREMYIDAEIRFDRFFCPVCNAALRPVNIYSDGLIAKSPHFRGIDGPHDACDPEDDRPPIQKGVVRNPPKTKVLPGGLRLPEVLYNRPHAAPVTTRTINPGTPDGRQCEDKGSSGRRPSGTALYRTQLIRAAANAYLGVLDEARVQQTKNRWDSKRRNEWIKAVLSEAPLRLYDGLEYTYQSAFRNLYFKPRAGHRIYHGKGLVVSSEGSFEIQADVSNSAESFEAVVQINVPAVINVASQRHTLKILDRLARSGAKVQWFAYGQMVSQENTYVLEIESLDHLYLHNQA